MYHLFVEIQYFTQLKRVENEYIESLIKSIDTIALETNARNVYSGHPFLYQFDTATKAVQMQAAQAAFSILDSLESGAKKLHGFRLLLDASDEQTAMNAFQIIKTQSASPVKNGLFLTSAAKKELGEYFNSTPAGDFWKVDDFRLTHRISHDTEQKFWFNEKSNEMIFGFFDRLAGKDSISFFLEGKKLSGVRENLVHAMESYFGSSMPILVFRCSLARRSSLKPIYSVLQEIERDNQEQSSKSACSAFKSAMERIQRQNMVRVEGIPSDSHLLSAKVALRAGFELRIEKCARLGIPFLIRMEDAHELQENAASVIMEAFKGLNCPGGILIAGNTIPSQRIKVQYPNFDFESFPDCSMEKFIEYAGTAVPVIGRKAEFLDTLFKAYPENALSRYTGLLLAAQNGLDEIPKRPIESLLESLPGDLLEIFSIILFAYGMASSDEINHYLDQTGRKERVRQTAFSQLYQCGLIRSEKTLEPTTLDLASLVAKALNERDASVREACASWMLDLSSSPREVPGFDLMVLLDSYSELRESEILSRSVREFTICNDRKGIENLINSEAMKHGFSGIKEKESLIQTGIEVKYVLLYGNSAEIESTLASLASRIEGCSGLCSSQFELYLSEWAWIRGDYKETIQLAKRALLGFQGTTFAWNRSACNRFLGMSALAQAKIFDAIEYLSNARELALSAEDDYELLIDLRFEAITFFMEGNLSKAIRIADRASEIAIRLDRSDLASWLDFFKGRVFFESGLYEKARICFLKAVCRDRCFPVKGAYKRAMIWNARTFVYEGSFRTAESILQRYQDDPESKLFQWESALFADLYPPSVEILEQILAVAENSISVHPEIIDWTSGYSSIETCAFSGKRGTGIRNIASAYLAYSKSMAGAWTEGSHELFILNRESGISEFDPSIVLFHYLQFLSTQTEANENSVDRATLLSKAFKHLQLRSSKIDESSMKNSYLTGSFWFKGLMNQAKKFKLI